MNRTVTDRPPSRLTSLLIRFAGGIVGLITAFAVVVACSWRSYPGIPEALTLRLKMPPGAPQAVEPLVVTGRNGAADLIVLRFVDEQTVRIGYDHWGAGGPDSAPIPFEAGEWRTLRVEMPSLTPSTPSRQPKTGELRVYLDDKECLRTPVSYYPRGADDIYFGLNAIEASTAPSFRGKLERLDGHAVFGGRGSYHTLVERGTFWLRKRPLRIPLVLGFAIAAGLAGHFLARRHGQLIAATLTRWRARVANELAPRIPPEERTSFRRAHAWFGGSAAVCTVVFAWLVTLGSFAFNHGEVFGSFYDYQAASFLQGRLDVPEEAIGGEAFEARGKLYGYFGPTPALLRLPFTITGLAFTKLSRAFMLVYFVATLAAAYALLLEARRLAGASSAPSPFAVIVLTLSTGLGSTVFFLGSRALIFHEAILCGIAFALWSVWASLRFLSAPQSRFWLGALALGLASLHARPPTGLFALTFLGCIALALAVREWRAQPVAAVRRVLVVGGLAFIALLSLNALAWLKFRTFDPAPLRISRPYMGNSRLVAIEGKSFHLVNLPFNFHTYIARPNLRLSPNFPWIYHDRPLTANDFPRAKIDLPDHTVAVTYTSPSLFLLATLGTLAAAVTLPALRAPVLCLWGAAAPMTLALLAAIATAQRYTGDFCPFLIAAAAVGLAGFELRAVRTRRLVRFTLAGLTVAAIAITAALTIQYQRAYLWGVPDDVRNDYARFRQRVDAFFGVPPPPPPPAA